VGEKEEQLMFYPAAKENHHAVVGGLLYHIISMLRAGEKLAEIYSWINKDLLYAGIILHDLAKIDEMEAGEIGLITEYTVEGQLLGHIIQGIKDIDRVAREEGADGEVSLLLQHMVLSHHYEPEFGSPKRPMIPEAELLHYLDMIDARMYDMRRVLDHVPPGGLSDRIWLLHNRRLYQNRLNTEPNENNTGEEKEG
jgi:3'-5' exoribonuclease